VGVNIKMRILLFVCLNLFIIFGSSALTLVKDDCVETVCPNGLYTFNFIVTNTGSNSVSGTVTDEFPSKYSIENVPAGCTVVVSNDRSILTCIWPSIAANSSASVLVPYRVNSNAVVGEYITNCARVRSGGSEDSYEDCDTNQVQSCSLSFNFIKDDCVATVCPGNSYSYNYQVINNGTADLGSVTLTDLFPFQYTVVSVPSNCQTTVTPNLRTSVTCTWSNILVGQTITIAIPYTVKSNVVVGTNVTNCAVVRLTNDPALNLEDCDTNLVINCSCLTYGQVCVTTAECCAPLLCLRHAVNPNCNGTSSSVYRCALRGGSFPL